MTRQRWFMLPPDAPKWTNVVYRVTGIAALCGGVLLLAMLFSGALLKHEQMARAAIVAVVFGSCVQLVVRGLVLLKWEPAYRKRPPIKATSLSQDREN